MNFSESRVRVIESKKEMEELMLGMEERDYDRYRMEREQNSCESDEELFGFFEKMAG